MKRTLAIIVGIAAALALSVAAYSAFIMHVVDKWQLPFAK